MPVSSERHDRVPRLDEGTTVLVGRSGDEELNAISTELRRRGLSVARVSTTTPQGRDWLSFDTAVAPDRCHGLVVRSVAHSACVAHHAERALRAEPVPSAVPLSEEDFHTVNTQAALLGRLALLDPRTTVNEPWAQERAELKVVQLQAARNNGLQVPDTLVTASADHARAFAAAHGGHVIAKALASPVVRCSTSHADFLYTSAVDGPLLDGTHSFATPMIFQERLRPRTEYRVTVVGSRVFTARTESTAESGLDWRRRLSHGVPFAAASLSDDLRQKIVGTVRELGLKYAAVDLIEEDDRTVFLELNPAGAYRWLEKGLRLPITSAVCDLLGTP